MDASIVTRRESGPWDSWRNLPRSGTHLNEFDPRRNKKPLGHVSASLARLLSLTNQRTLTNHQIAYDIDRSTVDSINSQIRHVVELVASLGITVPSTDLIQAYLRQHFDMLDLTIRVAELVAKEFGSSVDISFEYYQSPEEDDEQIIFFVKQRDAETYKRIESIWDAYVNDLNDASGWLHVTSDFRRRSG